MFAFLSFFFRFFIITEQVIRLFRLRLLTWLTIVESQSFSSGKVSRKSSDDALEMIGEYMPKFVSMSVLSTILSSAFPFESFSSSLSCLRLKTYSAFWVFCWDRRLNPFLRSAGRWSRELIALYATFLLRLTFKNLFMKICFMWGSNSVLSLGKTLKGLGRRRVRSSTLLARKSKLVLHGET